MGTVIFEIHKDDRCYFKITSHEGGKRLSSDVCLNWSGVVSQYESSVSEFEIKTEAIEWLKRKIKDGFDRQYSDRNSAEWLLSRLRQSKQLKLF